MLWKIFLAPFFGLLLSQFIKLFTWREKRTIFEKIFGYGGMPSSHAAFVSALTLAIAFFDTWKSPIFVVSLVFSILVLRDALGLRQEISRQAQFLEKLVEDLPVAREKLPKLNQRMGHSFWEILGGVILGFLVVLALSWL